MLHEKNIEEYVQQLRILLKDCNEFQTFEDFFDDNLLKQFIRGKKYDTKKTYDYLQNYLHVRTVRFADFMLTLRPSLTPLMDQGALKVLKKPDQQGRIIVVDRFRYWDASVYDAIQGISAWVLFLDEILRSFQAACDTGVVAILDFGDYTYSQARVLTPSIVIKGIHMLVNAMPMRYKAVHFINHGYLVNILITVVKPILKKKMKSRIHTHSTNASLHAHITPSILPTHYGGSLSDEDAFDEEFQQRISTREEFYDQFAERIKNN